MSLPIYTPSADRTSVFGGLRSAAARGLNKARAKFWTAASGVLNTVDDKVAQPALRARNAVVDTTLDAGKSVLGGLKIGTVLLVLIAGLMGYLYIRPFLPRNDR